MCIASGLLSSCVYNIHILSALSSFSDDTEPTKQMGNEKLALEKPEI